MKTVSLLFLLATLLLPGCQSSQEPDENPTVNVLKQEEVREQDAPQAPGN